MARRGELALVDDLDAGAKEDGLLAEEGERHEGTGKVVVVDVWRDAVALGVEIDDAAWR